MYTLNICVKLLSESYEDTDIGIDEDYADFFQDIALQLQEEGPRVIRQTIDSLASSSRSDIKTQATYLLKP